MIFTKELELLEAVKGLLVDFLQTGSLPEKRAEKVARSVAEARRLKNAKIVKYDMRRKGLDKAILNYEHRI